MALFRDVECSGSYPCSSYILLELSDWKYVTLQEHDGPVRKKHGDDDAYAHLRSAVCLFSSDL